MTDTQSNLDPTKKFIACFFAFILIPVFLLAEQAYVFWHGESYYNYGWAIPFLFVYLIHLRLDDLPKAEEDKAKTNSFLAILACLGFVLFRLAAEAFAPWRTSLWIEALSIVLLLYASLGILGGRAWQKHFSYCLLFILFLLPWPFRIEFYSVAYLTDWVMMVTVQFLSYVGEDVQQYGNIVQVGDTLVGVEEACSGIRSLQSLFMCAVFLGEMFRMKLWMRIVMLFVSLIIVLIINSIRSIVLSIITITGGPEAYTAWHDPVGNVAFIISIVFMFLIFKSAFKDPEESLEKEDFDSSRMFVRSKKLIYLILALLIPSAIIEAYFLLSEQYIQEPQYLSVKDLSSHSSWHSDDYSEVIQKKLDYDYGECYMHYVPGRSKADLYYYGYDSDKSESSLVSLVHQPSICMTMSGWSYQDSNAKRSIEIRVDGALIPFNHHIFEKEYKGKRLVSNVFFTSYDPIFSDAFSNFFEENWSEKCNTILRRIKIGRRDLTRQVILLGIIEEDPDVAHVLAEKLLFESIETQKSL